MLPVNYNILSSSKRRAVRNQYVEIQGGLCHHCKCALTGPPSPDVTKKKIRAHLFPSTFFDYPVHLHHDHGTGMTIGAVHNYCNAVLWQHHGE